MESAKSFLKNGATPDVVQFAQATLDEIVDVVIPAVQDAHAVDQALIDRYFTFFESSISELSIGVSEVHVLHTEERSHSDEHKACRSEEETACGTKRTCDYDLYTKWKDFLGEEEHQRELSREFEGHFCEPGSNGTLFSFRDEASILMPPWSAQWPIVQEAERVYDVTVPICEEHFVDLDDKTAECDAHQTNLDSSACQHAMKVRQARTDFHAAWRFAVTEYQRVSDEVRILEADRWNEYRTLQVVKCLLDRTEERNGRPCDEYTDEAAVEFTTCEQRRLVDVCVDPANICINYPEPPEVPPLCGEDRSVWTADWANRCIPEPPAFPCSAGYLAQEYNELWTPPQPMFHYTSDDDRNSHCNQRPECDVCEAMHEPEAFVVQPGTATPLQHDLVTLHWDGGSVTLTDEITCLSGSMQIWNHAGVPNDQLTGISGLQSGCEVKLMEHSRHCRATAEAEDNCGDDNLCTTLHADTMDLGTMASKASGVTVVCHNYHYDVAGSNTCSTEEVSEAACLAAVHHLLPEGVTQGRDHLVAGSWGWVPPGCSVQSHFTHNQNGDWAAHYNRLSSGANDGGYTPVCVNSASGENQCVGYFQAEAAVFSGAVIHENPATLANAHRGFSGDSFVDFKNPENDYIEWTVPSCAGGPAVLSFRYALASGDRPLRVLVNGQEEAGQGGLRADGLLSFPSTGAWHQWAVSSVFANLAAGTNTIKLEAAGSSGANVDALLVTSA